MSRELSYVKLNLKQVLYLKIFNWSERKRVNYGKTVCGGTNGGSFGGEAAARSWRSLYMLYVEEDANTYKFPKKHFFSLICLGKPRFLR